MENVILYFSLKYNGDFQKIMRALEMKEKVDENLFESLKSRLKSNYTTLISEDYPKQLRDIPSPPFVLYYYGHIDYVNEACIGVIGMRHPTDYGIMSANELVASLVEKNMCIVSGMAIGIDGISHRAAIHNKGHTIAVLGGGIDYIYPKSNEDIYHIMKEDHLIVSEVPYDIPPRKEDFPKRNRIIAGLSGKLLVIEAMIKSGTMITVGCALEQGKDVYAVPGRIHDNPGCNSLIAQGARLVMKVDDILEEIY